MTTQPNPDTPSPARGRRDFASVQAMTPSRYEVVADEEVADQAQALLAKMSGAV
jgi:hypothetical protein